MSENLKKCKVCGRTITDKNNVTGLCPKHQKAANTGAAAVGLAGLEFAIKSLVLKWPKQL